MFLSMCVVHGPYHINEFQGIYVARVVVSSRLHISPSFHLLTMLLYCLLHRIRTNFYGANMHGGKNLCFFVAVSPRQIYELFFVSENGLNKWYSSSYNVQMQIFLCFLIYVNWLVFSSGMLARNVI